MIPVYCSGIKNAPYGSGLSREGQFCGTDVALLKPSEVIRDCHWLCRTQVLGHAFLHHITVTVICVLQVNMESPRHPPSWGMRYYKNAPKLVKNRRLRLKFQSTLETLYGMLISTGKLTQSGTLL